jgi:hypothetical protein
VSTVLLSESFYQQIVEAPVPLDLRAVKALKKSPLTLDLYAWATRRVSYLSRPTLISWRALRLSFGTGYADTPQGRSRFREKVIDALRRVAAVYPKLRADVEERGVLLRPSATHIRVCNSVPRSFSGHRNLFPLVGHLLSHSRWVDGHIFSDFVL